MTLIPQKLAMSCWYASAQMLVKWKQDKLKQSRANLVPPDLDAQCRAIRDANTGMANPQIVAMAKRLGLVAVPPLSPQPSLIESWLGRTTAHCGTNGNTPYRGHRRHQRHERQSLRSVACRCRQDRLALSPRMVHRSVGIIAGCWAKCSKRFFSMFFVTIPKRIGRETRAAPA